LSHMYRSPTFRAITTSSVYKSRRVSMAGRRWPGTTRAAPRRPCHRHPLTPLAVRSLRGRLSGYAFSSCSRRSQRQPPGQAAYLERHVFSDEARLSPLRCRLFPDALGSISRSIPGIALFVRVLLLRGAFLCGVGSARRLLRPQA
jgi:hypothetical protein